MSPTMSCVIHPERPSVGNCARCGRVICEQCQTSKPGKLLVCNVCTRKSRLSFSLLMLLLPVLVMMVVLATIRSSRSPQVSVYDRHTWRTYTDDDGIEINSVVAAAVDERGDVWFAGGAFGGGVDRFQPAQETWTNYSRHLGAPQFSNSEPMYSNWVRDIATDGNVVWVATAVGLLRFEDEVWSAISISSGRPLFDVMDKICAGDDSCISSARNGGEPSEAVYAVAAGGGHLWAAVDDGSLAHFAGGDWVYLPAEDVLGPNPKQGIKDYVRPISTLALGDGVLWAGTLTQGVLRYDGQEWQRFDTSRGLPDNQVRDVAVFGGRVWVATAKGTAWIDVETGEIFTLADIENVHSVAGNAEQVYLATDIGLVALDLVGDGRSVYDASTGLPDGACWIVTVDDAGRVWVSTEKTSTFPRTLMLVISFAGAVILFISYVVYHRGKAAKTQRRIKEWVETFGAPATDQMRKKRTGVSVIILVLTTAFFVVQFLGSSSLSNSIDRLSNIVAPVWILYTILGFVGGFGTRQLVEFYIKRDDYAQAERVVRVLQQINPRSRNMLLMQQKIYTQQGRFTEAAQIARQVIRLTPGQATAYSNLGGLLADLGQYAEAEAACQVSIEISAQFPHPFNNLAWTLILHKEQLERAVELLEIGLSVSRSKAQRGACISTLSQAYFAMGKIPQALDKAKQALQLANQRDLYRMAELYYGLGTFQSAAGMTGEAQQSFQHTLTLAPQCRYADKAQQALHEMSYTEQEARTI